MTKTKSLVKIGLAGLLGLALGSVTTGCTSKQETTKVPVQKTYEAPKVSKTTDSIQEKWKPYVQANVACRFALEAEQKPEPMPMFGARVGVKKARTGFYADMEYGEMDSRETSSISYLDLKNQTTGVGVGASYDFVQGDKLIASATAEADLGFERNNITGRLGTSDINDKKTETIVGIGAGLDLEYKFNDTFSLTASGEYRYNFDRGNNNTAQEGRLGLGLKVNF